MYELLKDLWWRFLMTGLTMAFVLLMAMISSDPDFPYFAEVLLSFFLIFFFVVMIAGAWGMEIED
jgi:hypothetical protein